MQSSFNRRQNWHSVMYRKFHNVMCSQAYKFPTVSMFSVHLFITVHIAVGLLPLGDSIATNLSCLVLSATSLADRWPCSPPAVLSRRGPGNSARCRPLQRWRLACAGGLAGAVQRGAQDRLPAGRPGPSVVTSLGYKVVV